MFLASNHPAFASLVAGLLLGICYLSLTTRNIRSLISVWVFTYLVILLAYLSGYFASLEAIKIDESHVDLIASHQLFGKILLLVYPPFAALIFFYNQKLARPILAVACLGLLVLGILASHYGGELVFEYGIGVKK